MGDLHSHLLLILLGFAGFLLAAFIRHKKRRNEPLVCPLRAHCATVIRSEFGSFLGFPVELLGMLYYGLIILGHTAAAWFMPESAIITYALLFFSAGALLFSGYLTFIQLFTLRRLCSWCLFSAFNCLVIFTLAILGGHELLRPFLAAHAQTISAIHLFGIALGLGAATLSDLLFLRFLRDSRIGKAEGDALTAISQTAWVALGIIIASELGLFLADVFWSAVFVVKLIVLAVILLNGACLHLLVAPKLRLIGFGRKHAHRAGELHRIRRLAFALGPVSLVSWYALFVFSALPFSARALDLILGYGLLLILGILVGGIIERLLDRKSQAPAVF